MLAAAAFHGAPRDALPVLAGLDPAGPLPARTRWLAGVCLGALGRYRTAERWLAPGAAPAGSLLLSCRASHLRQLGRHAAAEPLDAEALAAATDPSHGRTRWSAWWPTRSAGSTWPTAERRLAAARAEPTGHDGRPPDDDGAWRAAVRLAWVTAEVSLLGDDPAAAAGPPGPRWNDHCWPRRVDTP